MSKVNISIKHVNMNICIITDGKKYYLHNIHIFYIFLALVTLLGVGRGGGGAADADM